MNGAMPTHCAPSPPIWREPPMIAAVHAHRHAVAADARRRPRCPRAPRWSGCAGSPSRRTAVRASVSGFGRALAARRGAGCAPRTESIADAGARGAGRWPARSGRRRARRPAASSGRSSSSRLPTTRGRSGLAVEHVLARASRRTGASPRRRGSPRGRAANSRTMRGSSGKSMPDLEEADAVAAQRRRRRARARASAWRTS